MAIGLSCVSAIELKAVGETRDRNRGMDRGQGLGINEAFFCDSCLNLEIDEAFQISHKLGLDLAE
jgi:hypothetical protein